MGLRFYIHLHTSRYSRCSRMEATRLVKRAVRAGLHGVVITEHHKIWPQHELDQLLAEAEEPGFVLLAGFEYTSSQGDILIYGLEPGQEAEFIPGQPPEDAMERVERLGAAAIAAHPTRAGMGFDERIATLPLQAMEVRSVNLKDHEQRLAIKLAKNVELPPVTCSDAHRIEDVGAYATAFLDPIQSVADLCAALKAGRFCPDEEIQTGVRVS